MILSDRDIEEQLALTDPDARLVVGRKLLEPLRILGLEGSDDPIQPASVDLRLGNSFQVFRDPTAPFVRQDILARVRLCDLLGSATIDTRNGLSEFCSPMEEVVLPDHGEPFLLKPGQFALATTKERVGIPNWQVGRVEGKSSLGRMGLIVHSTAGYLDPYFGYDQAGPAEITLELFNLAPLPLKIWPGQKICQVAFEVLRTPCRRPYGDPSRKSKYQGQRGATQSRAGQDRFERVPVQLVPGGPVWDGLRRKREDEA